MSKLPPIYGVLDKGEKHLAKPEVKAEIQKNVEEFKKRNAMLPPNQSSKGGRTRLSSKFNRCVKSVKKTVKARKGSNKESASIAICTKSVLHKRGRTIKRYTRKRLITQKKFRGGATPLPPSSEQGFGLFRTETRESVPPPPATWETISNDMEATIRSFGEDDNRMTDLEEKVHSEILNTNSPLMQSDSLHVTNIYSFALERESKPIIKALHSKGVSKEFFLDVIDTVLREGDITPGFNAKLKRLRPFVANLS